MCYCCSRSSDCALNYCSLTLYFRILLKWVNLPMWRLIDVIFLPLRQCTSYFLNEWAAHFIQALGAHRVLLSSTAWSESVPCPLAYSTEQVLANESCPECICTIAWSTSVHPDSFLSLQSAVPFVRSTLTESTKCCHTFRYPAHPPDEFGHLYLLVEYVAYFYPAVPSRNVTSGIF